MLLSFERQQPVISRPLLRVAKDIIGLHSLPEPYRRIRIASMEIRVIRPGGFAKGISEPLGIVTRTSTEQIVEGFHGLRSRVGFPDSLELSKRNGSYSKRVHWSHDICGRKTERIVALLVSRRAVPAS